jgi:hypothetical protein
MIPQYFVFQPNRHISQIFRGHKNKMEKEILLNIASRCKDRLMSLE